jgi:gliding motility-associated-like protein
VVDFVMPEFTALGPACFSDEDMIVYTGDPLTANAVFNWEVENGEISYNGGDTILVNWQMPGDHMVTLSLDSVCITAPISEIITKVGVDVEIFSETEVILQFAQIELATTTETFPQANGNVTYSWSPADNLSCTDCPNPIAVPSENTVYTVTATDELGCSDVDSISINVVPNHSVYIPNVFTPNDDGQNDNFLIYGQSISTINLYIFDRWGATVYQTQDVLTGWDGSYKNNPANSGVYVYVVEVVFMDGFNDRFTGNVSLIR